MILTGDRSISPVAFFIGGIMAIDIPNIGAGYNVRDIYDSDGNRVVVDVVDRFGVATGETENSQMLEAIDGNRNQANGEKWHTCPVCGLAFPEGEMNLIKGKWYSIEYNCAADVSLDPKAKPVDNSQVEHLTQFNYTDLT